MLSREILSMVAVFLLASPASAQAPAFPSQRITIVVPATSGGATDIIARLISQSLTQSTGQNVIVENRTGANGNIGGLSVARATPDGYTLLLAPTNNLAGNQFTMKNIGHDPATDLLPVALVAEAPEIVAVTKSFPANNMQEFLAVVRGKPGVYNYGSPGVGVTPHLAVERLLRATGTRMVHVPFRGAAAAIMEVAGGGIEMSMASLGSIEPFRQAGTVRILGVASAQRLQALPDVPTFAEQGLPNLEMSVWWGVVAPKATPASTVQYLNERLRATFRDPANVETLARLGIVARAELVETFSAFARKEVTVWKAVIDEIGLQPE